MPRSLSKKKTRFKNVLVWKIASNLLGGPMILKCAIEELDLITLERLASVELRWFEIKNA